MSTVLRLVRRPAPLLLTLAVLAGCAPGRLIDPATADGRDVVNRQAEGQSAVVRLATGEEVGAASLRFHADGATWVDPETGAGRSASYAEVRLVRFPTPQRSALVGLGVGTALGTAFGLYATTGPDALGGPTDAGFVAGGAILGAFVGTAVAFGKDVLVRVYRLRRAP